ncbi:hypothetical protein AMEX_G11395 [Astyanax mexicanus]|uniref:Uncharacterized protein n=1 Tax=Astyanax mexicanus TaxID=7994 RepID=A0A8T2LXE6_ASTMX|nr:hypothetical protein AMEX_G11395 [Astyanax mexicanus]
MLNAFIFLSTVGRGSSSPLSEDQFQCSICLDVFTDPVSTPCGHNFCITCLSQYWNSTQHCHCPLCKEEFTKRPELKINTTLREVADHFKKKSVLDKPEVLCDVCTEEKLKAFKSCLNCGATFCKTHLELHSGGKLKNHKLIHPVENLEDYICQKHERPMELFCRDDQTGVCQFCTETDHKNHNTVPIEEESGEKKTQLGETQTEVQQMIQDRLMEIKEIKHSVDIRKRNTEKEISDSVEVFTALIRSIERSQAELLEVMEEKQKAAERQAEEFIKDLEQEITELKRRDTELEQLSHTEDHLHLLQIYPSLCRPPHTTNWTDISVDPHLSVETVRNTLSQLQKISSELKRIQQYAVDVTLDPDTAHPYLILSKDGKQGYEFTSVDEIPIGDECRYCRTTTSGSLKHLKQRHIRYAIYFKEDGKEKFTIPCLCKEGKDGNRSHWHCPKCGKLIARQPNFKVHLEKHGCVVGEKGANQVEVIPEASESKDTAGKFICQYCKVLPPELKQEFKQIPEKFEPVEKVCPYCPGPTPPDLSSSTVITTNATVYGLYSVKRGVTVAVKHCPVCQGQVRFQEYSLGYHNFNNRVLLSIPLCSMLTTAIKNNTAIGRFLSMMEDHMETNIHHNTIRKAFFHFSAMTNYSYNFSCNRCGHNPPVLIADANWKVAFDLPVNLLKRPSAENIQASNLSVNITDQWEQLEKQLIAAGFCDEQLNRELANSRYFLCQLKDMHYMFMLRLVFHLHNQRVNNSFFEKMCRLAKGKASIGINGRICLFGDEKPEEIQAEVSDDAGSDSDHPFPDKVAKAKDGNEHSAKTQAGQQFSVTLFPIVAENEEKLLRLHKGVKNTKQTLLEFELCHTKLPDLQTLLPLEYLEHQKKEDLPALPWLTDDIVNCRISQLVDGQKFKVLPTFEFVCWWRDIKTTGSITSRNKKILQVIDGVLKQIRVYDSLQLYPSPNDWEMDILRQAFQETWDLAAWDVQYPQQWHQKDSQNCGVFVCTMAEMEVRGIKLGQDTLSGPQLQFLRRYHATSIICDVMVEEVLKSRQECMAADINVCVFQKLGTRRSLYPEVKNLHWVQCESCKGWLHTDCAGVSDKATRGHFTCGCRRKLPLNVDRTLHILHQEGIDGLIDNNEIKKIYEALHADEQKSSRMYLWKHPATSLRLKQRLKPKFCHFSDENTIKMTAKIKAALNLGSEIQDLNLMFDVMMPEIIINILQKNDQVSRYMAEMFLASGPILD